jgi:hypothetical protein
LFTLAKDQEVCEKRDRITHNERFKRRAGKHTRYENSTDKNKTQNHPDDMTVNIH